MSDHKKHDKKKDDKKREFTIPEDAKKLAKLNFKKFKKNGKGYYDSKKELKRAYYGNIVDLLPESIALLIKYGHITEVQECKAAIYDKIVDKDFVSYLIKQIKDDLEFENMILLPNIIYDVVREANKKVMEAKAENPESTLSYDLEDLIELSHLILKKKIKKFTKAGIDETVAFDILSIIPDAQILNKSAGYHMKELFTALYAHAKNKDIDFKKIMEVLFKDGNKIEVVIAFALLERKDKLSTFNESQKKLFNDITDYVLKTLEDMKKDDIYSVLKAYAETRRRDEAQKKDSQRRYYISSLPESDYPKIIKTVGKLVERYPDWKKYF